MGRGKEIKNEDEDVPESYPEAAIQSLIRRRKRLDESPGSYKIFPEPGSRDDVYPISRASRRAISRSMSTQTGQVQTREYSESFTEGHNKLYCLCEDRIAFSQMYRNIFEKNPDFLRELRVWLIERTLTIKSSQIPDDQKEGWRLMKAEENNLKPPLPTVVVHKAGRILTVNLSDILKGTR